jgi:hypothetical protein
VLILENWDEIRTAMHVAQRGTVSGAAEAMAVLTHPDCAPLFAPTALAEATLAATLRQGLRPRPLTEEVPLLRGRAPE